MPRLFTGLAMPDAARTALKALSQPLPGARWADPADLHLTLRFIGDVDNGRARALSDALAEIEADAFTLELAGLGTFGGAEPHALWIGAKENAQLASLARKHERAARSIGLAPETRKFQPHVTLARLALPSLEPLARYLSRMGTTHVEPVHVAKFVLFSAKPHSGGGPYAQLESFPLRGGLDEDAFADEV